MQLPKHLTEQIAKEAEERYAADPKHVIPAFIEARREGYITAKTDLLESGEVAIAFTEFCNIYSFNEISGNWITDDNTYTTKELYTLFIQDYFKP
jgi:hypothetical protein